MELGLYKYVDDFLASECLCLSDGFKLIQQSKQSIEIHAWKSQALFDAILTQASNIGMTVNEKKTKLLCISSSLDSSVTSYIRMADNSKIKSQKELKQLGFLFSSKPSVCRHIQGIAARFRRRLWFLRHLKKAGVRTEDLIHSYRCFLLPIIDQSSVVYHPLLSEEQSSLLERLQSTALKTILGYKKSYGEIKDEWKIESITERRQRLTDKFILKSSTNPRFEAEWFPEKRSTGHDLRSKDKYAEFHARTARLFNAPLFYYRRRLNELTAQTDDNNPNPDPLGTLHH